MDVRRYADLFLTESRDHLTAFNHLLLEWERDPAAPEPVGGIFRAVHTIKGMAATMGYTAVADLSHRVENLLDLLRRGEKPATPATLELLFKSADALDRAIGDAVAGKDDPAPFAELLVQIDREAGGTAEVEAPRQRRSEPVMLPGTGPGRGRVVRVGLRSEAALNGARAILAIKKAEALGSVSAVTPAPSAMETEGFDGKFSFRIDSEADSVAVEEAIRTAGDVDTVEVAEAVHEAVAEGVRGARNIRVDLRRLDELMNQIGELVIARGRLSALTARLAEPDLDEVSLQIGRLAGRLQSEIIQARMTPVWQVFDRFPRMVRDLARQTGKQVAFRVEGKEIELDRAILDELADPLVHLLRNAVDHGIEAPEERVASGKPAVGQLVVAAVRERSSVAIRVTDDGRGVNRAAVLARARETGLVGADQQELGEEELFRVLTRSGFSTAREVTDVSGRGVGIDVVATAARALGGSLEIRSEEGKGTVFTLRLPVTLAIVRALLARVGTELYALPLTHVAETVDLKAEDIRRVQGRETMLLRGLLLPLVRLGEVLGAAAAPATARLPVIVLEMGERRTGVVVDDLMGQQEIVVKNFEAPLGMLPLFSGATILGDGAPALILDAGGLM
ncbi:MAG: chemotaxis protein CheA [Gemmatimonadales bacterium]|nr:chemotaxis protein CheA [Gemmatimonadales bacterium]